VGTSIARILTLWAALCCALLPAQALSQSSTGTLRVRVLPAFSLQNIGELSFGILAPSPVAGTATINAQTGARTTAGGTVAAGGTVSRAQFIGTGTPGRVVTFSLNPSPSIVITNALGPQTMTINQVRVSINGGSPQPVAPNHTLPASGNIMIGVGGRLNVAANQAEGEYTGLFTLTMNYQ
jgi:Domain of unknown function (DUF4402)